MANRRTKRQYRRAVRVAARTQELTAEQKQQVQDFLRDRKDENLNELVNYCQLLQDRGLCSGSLPTAGDDDQTWIDKLVDWFIANWREILQFIIDSFFSSQD